jgi:hypothetical protein
LGQNASRARRITLLGRLLVLTVAASAECVWVVWLQDVWTATPSVASPHPFSPVAASERIEQYAANPKQ